MSENENMDVGSLLADQVDRLFGKSVTRAVLDEAEAGALPQALWQELEALGISLALVPESAGGVGLSWADMEGVLYAVGYHAAPVPLAETLVGSWALASAGLDIPEGPLALASTCLTLDDAGRVTGCDRLVPWGGQAAHILAVAKRGDDSYLCLIARGDGPAFAPQATIGRIPGIRMNLAGVTPLQVAKLPAEFGALGFLPHLAIVRSVQMAGCLDRMLALCVEYGNTRTQFGRPIGKFQAIQHLIAELAEQAAAAQVAGRFGCRSLDKGNGEYGAAVAKTRIGTSATRSTAIAHQVFGAIGITDEHTLHFFTRRLWQWRDEGGSEHWWAERLGRQVIAAGGQALWHRISGCATE